MSKNGVEKTAPVRKVPSAPWVQVLVSPNNCRGAATIVASSAACIDLPLKASKRVISRPRTIAP